MPSIWITGDTHGDVTRLNNVHFPEQKDMTKDDVVIICGDFGLLWDYKGENEEEKFWLDWLNDKPFTTLSTAIMNASRVFLPCLKRYGMVLR